MLRLFFLLTVFACTALAAEPIVLIPETLILDGNHARQQLLVERGTGGQLTGDVTAEAELVSSNPDVVKIENGVAIPAADGSATITAKRGDSFATAAVTVRGQTQPAVVSFRNHIQPILAKSGCSLGACHGAAAGQGGFRLSLRGYDDEGDFLSLTRAAMGRRITPGDPARSLILVKPTGAVPHKGGEKFKVGSVEYQTLVDWIANGTPGPQPNDARIERLELLPPNVVLQPGVKQQVLVRAHFSDGHIEDVTRFAKYTATNQSVATVDDFGQVSVIGNGESAVTAWYLSQIAVGTITAPFPHAIADATWSAGSRRNWIDDLVLEKLRALRLAPSPPCSDSEFIRRASIDTCGILPTAEETRTFLADTAPDKRDRLIERLLTRPEFVDYWSYKWSDLLLVTKRKVKPAAMWAYYQWIREQVATNTPWDEFARRLITAQGSTLENGAANYFVIHPDPRELAETTSLTFLGVSVNCAKCHNHPMEKWTNNDYYGFANLFSRVRFKNGNGEGDNVIFADAQGDLVQPLTGVPQAPRPLDGDAIALDHAGDRREPLAAWLTSKENPYFAKAIVNRLWANFYGLGLVENVDDIRATNPASNEQLFSAAATRLGELGFDLRALMREILQSATYQRSSTPIPENQADTRFYARYYPRRLMAEVMQDAIAQVTGVPTIFKTKDPTVE
ncbi:MAG TPA: DUF1549 domain-containing protein, partial [Chthoniobacteraceae bacterium]|nr:DUF1549 domain-containing protein [Chthoniobacteraceae bacterium]